MIQITSAEFPLHFETVKNLFREYIESASANLEFQDYETELAELPGKYKFPEGRLLLAWKNDDVIGCAALRRIDPATCEMKRVYVRPSARGVGLGRRLVETIIAEAKAAGYTRICLDVLPEFKAARNLYQSLGFIAAPAVAFNPVPGTEFLGLEL